MPTKHWTQLRKNRKKMSDAVKLSWTRRRERSSTDLVSKPSVLFDLKTLDLLIKKVENSSSERLAIAFLRLGYTDTSGSEIGFE